MEVDEEGEPSEEVTFINTFGIAFSDGDQVIGWKRADDGKYEMAAGTSAQGTTYTGGHGITVAGSTISVDGSDGLAIDTNQLVVKLATLPGLEFDGSSPGKLRSKTRFTVLKGSATQAYSPSNGTITIDGVSAVEGELPDLTATGGVLTALTAHNIYVDNNDEVFVARFDFGGGTDANSWDVSTAYNFTHLLRGYASYDPDIWQSFVHDENGALRWGAESGVAYITAEVGAATYNDAATPKTIAYGSGTMQSYTGTGTTVTLDGVSETVYTVADSATPVGKHILWHRVNGLKLMWVEPC